MVLPNRMNCHSLINPTTLTVGVGIDDYMKVTLTCTRQAPSTPLTHGPFSASTCYHQGIVTLIRHHAIHLTEERRAMIHGEGDDALVIEVCLLLYDGNMVNALKKATEMGVHLDNQSGNSSNDLSGNSSNDLSGDPTTNQSQAQPVIMNNESPFVHNPTTSISNTESLDSSTVKPDTQHSTPSLVSTDRSSMVDRDGTYRPSKTTPSSIRGREGVFIRYHPTYRDYFDWLLEDGLDKAIIEESMKSEHLDPSVSKSNGYDMKVLSRNLHEIVAKDNPDVILAVESPDVPITDTSMFFIRRRNHPLFAKYYNKLDLGISEEEVRLLLERDGIDPGVLRVHIE